MLSKLALVTGASSGLGKALSVALSKRGIPLVLTARNEHTLKQAALGLPDSTQLICCDLSKPEDRKKLLGVIQERKPDLIINNAGFGLYGPALSHSTSDLKEMIEVNAQALMELSLEGARALLKDKKKGTILNISSATAFFPYPTFCVYAATKAFVNSFSQGLDKEMKRHGIRILTVCPGQINTGFRTRASGNFPQKKDRISMSSEATAELILKQIEKPRSLSIIDWRYRCLLGLSRLLPKRLLQAVLEKSLEERYNPQSPVS
jgi:uncharacterized protein